jgi:23S rRNA (adenine2503-C2)-methyltransferase
MQSPPPHHIFDYTPESLARWCEQRSMPAFRAKQVLEWVYLKGVIDPAAMTNLGKLDRELLAREMTFRSCDIVREQRATDGTRKLLVEWREGGEARTELDAPAPTSLKADVALHVAGVVGGNATRQTECVMIPTEDRRTACISSQVGCPVGCKFCASGLGGLDANLSAGQIVEQVWLLRRLMHDQPDLAGATVGHGDFARISNVVFMGMGEPLSNLASVVPAIRTICALWGHAISARRVTISTVGLPKAIEKLAEQLELPVTLALSLHAPNDTIRRLLIPWAEYTTIAELLASCQKWFDKTGREITLEYTLLGGVNDRPQHARELADIAQHLRANINLIRYNEVAGLPFERPTDDNVRSFQDTLRAAHINTHIRASRGRDIAAACGQLRHETGNKQRKRDAANS